MEKTAQDHPMLIDYVTGKPVADVGAEANRQAVERFLVDIKGYRREDITVDYDVALEIAGKPYRTQLDLVVASAGRPAMVVKCVAGSLDSREREAVSAARVVWERPIPCAVVSDGKTALVYDPVRKKLRGEGLDAIPSPGALRELTERMPADPLAADRLEREKIIFRSYDIMNVNVHRNAGR